MAFFSSSKLKIRQIFEKRSFFPHFREKYFRCRLQTFQKCLLDHYLQLLIRLYVDFRILTAVKSKKLRFLIKKNHFFLIFLRNTLDTGFKLSRNVYWAIIYNFCKDCMVIFGYWRQSNQKTAISYKKKIIFSKFSCLDWILVTP